MRDRIFGYIVACSYDKEDEFCPFIELRKLPLDIAFKAIQQMDDVEIRDMILHHNKCKKKKGA